MRLAPSHLSSQLTVYACVCNSRKAVLTAHPDKGGSEAKMATVNEAYEVLSKPGMYHSLMHSPFPIPFSSDHVQTLKLASMPAKTRMTPRPARADSIKGAGSRADIRLRSSSSKGVGGSSSSMDIRASKGVGAVYFSVEMEPDFNFLVCE